MPIPSDAPKPCEICGDMTDKFCCGDCGPYEHMICDVCYETWAQWNGTASCCNIDWEGMPWFTPTRIIAGLQTMEQELR